MKLLKLLTLSSLLLFISCDKDSSNCDWSDIGIIGKWELKDVSYGQIVGPIVPCCKFLTFSINTDTDSCEGNFRSEADGAERNGTFDLDVSEGRLVINTEAGNIIDANYQLNEERLTISYLEDDVEVVESWGKVE